MEKLSIRKLFFFSFFFFKQKYFLKFLWHSKYLLINGTIIRTFNLTIQFLLVIFYWCFKYYFWVKTIKKIPQIIQTSLFCMQNFTNKIISCTVLKYVVKFLLIHFFGNSVKPGFDIFLETSLFLSLFCGKQYLNSLKRYVLHKNRDVRFLMAFHEFIPIKNKVTNP